jgi:hypothetical protein
MTPIPWRQAGGLGVSVPRVPICEVVEFGLAWVVSQFDVEAALRRHLAR